MEEKKCGGKVALVPVTVKQVVAVRTASRHRAPSHHHCGGKPADHIDFARRLRQTSEKRQRDYQNSERHVTEQPKEEPAAAALEVRDGFGIGQRSRSVGLLHLQTRNQYRSARRLTMDSPNHKVLD